MLGRYVALMVIMVVAALGGGIAIERYWFAIPKADEAGAKIAYWVAPMDPNFRRDQPGKSPMGMDLVPVYEGQEPGGDPSTVELSPVEINAIGVRTATARLELVGKKIETVGFVGYDEHRISHIHMRVEGWIEDLRVRAVGDRVAEGDLLFEVYAPEITIGSYELIRGISRGNLKEIDIARGKLRNFGVTQRQIAEMEKSTKPAEHIRVYAPQDGVVIDLDAADGMYLKPDTRALSLADLSSLWLLADVFERDLGRLSSDMRFEARFEALPGKVFQGKIDYIYPELDPKTRTLPVRLQIDNHDGRLRPKMFGTVSLLPSTMREAMTVPSEAVIRTGRAERVILQTGDGTFQPRLVTTGLRDSFGEGGRTEIVQGLVPGEVVVASAQFLIDSESALSAGLMRFAPTKAEPATGKGILVALDQDKGIATIDHNEIAALDWPAMLTDFAYNQKIALDRLSPGKMVKFKLVRGADRLLSLSFLAPDDGIDAEGTGVVMAVTSDGKLTLNHDPIPSIGWPAMKMDLPVAGVDVNSVPLNIPVRFNLAKGHDGLFTIVGMRAEGGGMSGHDMAKMQASPAEQVPAKPPIIVSGTIEAVDQGTRKVRIAHGPISEIGMPGMTMDFDTETFIDLASLPIGQTAKMVFNRPDGITMVLREVRVNNPVYRVTGRVDAFDLAARKATITHGPIAEIGMPGMTMEFPVSEGLTVDALPLGADLTFMMERAPDFSLTVIAVDGNEGTQ